MKNTTSPSEKTSLLSTKNGEPLLIAGPCSAETEEQLMQTALRIKEQTRVHIFRAGIWKPRTRPNSFEGVGRPGLSWLRKVKERTNMPVACEVANSRHVAEALEYGVDVLWIGARTSVNPFSVQEIADSLAGTDTTVLVKNPINPDLALWIGAIERLQKAGIKDIGAIHRGFSTSHSSRYRNAPMWKLALSFRKELPQIPLLCDPSHIGGRREVLQELAQQALDLGMDGLMIESHLTPDSALSDAKQQITPEVLARLLGSLTLQRASTAVADHEHLEQLTQELDCLDHELFELLSLRARLSGKIGTQLQSGIKESLAPAWEGFLAQLTNMAKQQGAEEVSIHSLFTHFCEYALHARQVQQPSRP